MNGFFVRCLKNLQKEVLVITIQARRKRFEDQNAMRFPRMLQAIDVLNRRIGLQQGQLNDYRSVLQNYRSEVASGQLSVIDYVNTVKSFILLQNELTIARSDRSLLINNYNYWNW